jgi:hypothetical protein
MKTKISVCSFVTCDSKLKVSYPDSTFKNVPAPAEEPNLSTDFRFLFFYTTKICRSFHGFLIDTGTFKEIFFLLLHPELA